MNLQKIRQATELLDSKLIDLQEWTARCLGEDYRGVWSEEYLRRCAVFVRNMLNGADDCESDEKDTEILSQLREAKVELEKERKKLQSENIQYIQNQRLDARADLIQEKIAESIKNLEPFTIRESNGQYGIHVKSVNAYNNSFELLIKDLQHYKKNSYRIILLSGSKTRAARLAGDIMNEGLNCFYTDDYDHELLPGQIMVCYGKVRKGYEYPILQFAVITETDIFGAERKKKKRHRTYEGEKIQSFTALNIGDYVVHENHGLGVYRGILQKERGKARLHPQRRQKHSFPGGSSWPRRNTG